MKNDVRTQDHRMTDETEKVLNRKWALLHKLGFERGSPFPGRTYPTATVTGMPSAV
jgi:hypothetical protein